MEFTIAQIRAAYWKQFHKSGEQWFPYFEGDEAECEGATEAY